MFSPNYVRINLSRECSSHRVHFISVWKSSACQPLEQTPRDHYRRTERGKDRGTEIGSEISTPDAHGAAFRLKTFYCLTKETAKLEASAIIRARGCTAAQFHIPHLLRRFARRFSYYVASRICQINRRISRVSRALQKRPFLPFPRRLSLITRNCRQTRLTSAFSALFKTPQAYLLLDSSYLFSEKRKHVSNIASLIAMPFCTL